MKSVFYWSPFLTNVATISAVIESAVSLKRYSKNFEPFIIDVCGEFHSHKEEIKKKNIEIINLISFKYFHLLPKTGYLNSRISFILIFLTSFFPLIFLLYKRKPDYFISHLITSLPILIGYIFKFKTKFILRISGLPRLNFLRKSFWRIFGEKIDIITTPTIGTLNQLKKSKIFNEKKIHLLKDPIIDIRKICSYKKEIITEELEGKDLLVAIGRLTKQKNFEFLIESISDILKKENKLILIIIGEGENREKLEKKIKEKDLEDKIKLIGFKNNIYNYLSRAKFFILSSLWEDPGWVLLEAAACNIPILSSNCRNGPIEIINNDKAGILFRSNSKDDFIKKFYELFFMKKKEIFMKKLTAKKKSKEYTKFNHCLELKKIILK